MDLDVDTLTKEFTGSILQQCDQIETELASHGIDPKFSRLISIHSAYNSMKQLLMEMNDTEAEQELFKLIEFDIKQIGFKFKPTVFNSVGHS